MERADRQLHGEWDEVVGRTIHHQDAHDHGDENEEVLPARELQRHWREEVGEGLVLDEEGKRDLARGALQRENTAPEAREAQVSKTCLSEDLRALTFVRQLAQ